MRMGIPNVVNTTLPSVVTTKVLRIVAVGWTPENQACLRFEALGCLPPPGMWHTLSNRFCVLRCWSGTLSNAAYE